MRKGSRSETVSTRLSPRELIALENLVEVRGGTRSSLLHDLVVAAIEGRVAWDIPAGFSSYSTRKGAPQAVTDERIQARLVALQRREAAADARHDVEQAQKVTSMIDQSKARLNAETWPEGFEIGDFLADD